MYQKLTILATLIFITVLGTAYLFYKGEQIPLPVQIPETLYPKVSIQSPLEESVIKDLSERLNVNIGNISVVKIKEAGWSDVA